MDESKDKLLRALQEGDIHQIDLLGRKLLLTREGKINVVERDAFEAYAPCHIVNPTNGCRGIIVYAGNYYYFA